MKKIIISSLFIIAATSALANDVRIAFSKTENIEIFARNPDANGQWCADDIEINLSSANPTIDYNAPSVDQMIVKVGEAVIAKNCASAQRLTVYRGDNDLLLGVALKDSKWAMIRDGANEEDPPTGEEDSEQTVASSNTESSSTSSGALEENHASATKESHETPMPASKASEQAQEPAPVPAQQNAATPKKTIVVPQPDKNLIQSQLDEVKKSGLRDMPFTKENENEITRSITKIAASYEKKAGESQEAVEAKILKSAVEDMGYSFDLTLRRAFLFEDMSVSSIAGIFRGTFQFVSRNSDAALSAGFISKRTYDIISSLAEIPSKENIEFLGYVQECQDKNSGKCNSSILLTLMKNNGVIKTEIPSSGTRDRELLRNEISKAYNLYPKIKNANWIETDNGNLFNMDYFLLYDTLGFWVNNDSVSRSLNTMNIYEEEKEFFNQIGTIQAAPNFKGGKGWMLWVVLLSGVFVLIDAKRIGVKKGLLTGMGNMGAWSWFFGTLLMWIIVFPLYFFYRGKYKAALNPVKVSPQTSVDPTAEIEKFAALKEKGHITDAEFTARKKQLLGL